MFILKQNNSVKIKFNNNWFRKGNIIKKQAQLRSYLVLTEEGKQMKHNRHHLLKTKKPTNIDIDYYDNIIPENNKPNS